MFCSYTITYSSLHSFLLCVYINIYKLVNKFVFFFFQESVSHDHAKHDQQENNVMMLVRGVV